jgi:hypothetical protein
VSNMKDTIKNKMKKNASVHQELIEPVNTNVNVDVNVNVNRRRKFEERFTRQTYYIENDLLEKINRMAGNEKGEKTRIINEALRKYLLSVEKG